MGATIQLQLLSYALRVCRRIEFAFVLCCTPATSACSVLLEVVAQREGLR